MLALRHRTDPLPHPGVLAALECLRVTEATTIAAVQSKTADDMERRFADGHRAYLARLDGVPAAFGWVATQSARIGEISASLTLPPRHRYLWNFLTLPDFRGRGIYPRLLRAILLAESSESDWSWIMYAPENRASGAGIAKAGFTPVASVAFDAGERAAFRELRPGAGVMVEHLLGIPPTSGALTPCWKCVRAGHGAMSCTDGACHCDYQRPDVHCAA
jgi:GNAT superfamily N-acetyltransferase